VVAALALVAAACGGDPAPHRLAGQVLSPPPDMSSLTLPDATGQPFALKAAEGGLLLVYFGYTGCPDVCPTTLSDVRTALKRMGSDDAARVRLAMASVDPERDTPRVLSAYVDSFVPGSVALTTLDADALKVVGDAFGAIYRVSSSPTGAVDVEHSAFLYALDDRGTLRVQWPFGVKAKELADDLTALLDDIDTTRKQA
jgi:protein SCO1/2